MYSKKEIRWTKCQEKIKAALLCSEPACKLTTCMLSHSVMSDSATPWTVAHQALLSMGFSKQEYWSELPPPENLPDPGMETTSPMSPALAGIFFTTEPPRKPPQNWLYCLSKKLQLLGVYERIIATLWGFQSLCSCTLEYFNYSVLNFLNVI